MKQLGFLLLMASSHFIYAQKANLTKPDKKRNTVSFVAKFDKNKVTKDGYYVGNYIVAIDPGQAKKLDGKKIKVTGRVTIVKGLENEAAEYDTNGKLIIKQGRSEDTRHILSPHFTIIGK